MSEYYFPSRFVKLDKTGTYDTNPEIIHPFCTNLPDKNVSFWTEERIHVAEQVWNGMSNEFQRVFGSHPIPFNLSQMYATEFPDEHKVIAFVDPPTGRIYFDVKFASCPQQFIGTLAHEIGHVYSVRTSVSNRFTQQEIRIGLAVGTQPASTFAFYEQTKWNGKNKDTTLPFALIFLNEAVTESATKRLLRNIAPTISDVSIYDSFPDMYTYEQRLYNAIVDNLVIAYNRPQFRIRYSNKEKEAYINERLKRVQEHYSWSDTINRDDIISLFEHCMWDKSKQTHMAAIATCISYAFGETAWKHLIQNSIITQERCWPTDMRTTLWELVTIPAKKRAFGETRRNFTLDVAGKTFPFFNDGVNKKLPLYGWEDKEGYVSGVYDMLRKYTTLFASPLSYNQCIYSLITPNTTIQYGNIQPTLGELNAKRTSSYCFLELCRTLQVKNNPSNCYHDTNGSIQTYALPDFPSLYLAKVTPTNADMYYWIVMKND